MSAPTGQTKGKPRKADQGSLKLKEGLEMKAAVEKGRVWISEHLGTKVAIRALRGLAVGALVVAGTGLYFSVSQGEAGSPSTGGEITQAFQDTAYLGSQDHEAVERLLDEVREAFIGISASSSETTRAFPDTPYYRDPDWRETQMAEESISDQAFQDTAYLGSQDHEAVERLLDEVREAFIGIPASGSETTRAFEALDYWVQRDEAEEMLFDELREAFIGIPASSSETAGSALVSE
jgi:hypothetical protein